MPLEIVVLIISLIEAVVLTILVFKLYKEFGWIKYKKLGADIAVQSK